LCDEKRPIRREKQGIYDTRYICSNEKIVREEGVCILHVVLAKYRLHVHV